MDLFQRKYSLVTVREKNLLNVTHDNCETITYRNGVVVKSVIKLSQYSYCAKFTLHPPICCSNRTYLSV